jgi:hypothetical protein
MAIPASTPASSMMPNGSQRALNTVRPRQHQSYAQIPAFSATLPAD